MGVKKDVLKHLVMPVEMAGYCPPMAKWRAVVVIIGAIKRPHRSANVVSNSANTALPLSATVDAFAPYPFDRDAIGRPSVDSRGPLETEVRSDPDRYAEKDGEPVHRYLRYAARCVQHCSTAPNRGVAFMAVSLLCRSEHAAHLRRTTVPSTLTGRASGPSRH
jgi:hypothetical protein